jgi:isocitrate dehydrogenase (NAD+)
MLLNHAGYTKKSMLLEKALEICTQYEKKIQMTGRSDGATGTEFAEYIMDTIQDPSLESKWEDFQ